MTVPGRGQDSLSDDWTTVIDQFTDYLRFEKQYSAHTVNQYRAQLLESARYFSAIRENWFKLQSEDIRRYSMQLRGRQLNGRTISLKLSCLRGLYKFLQQKRDHLLANPAEAIKGPKFQKPLPKNLDVDQVAQLLEIPPEDALAIRDKAIMELLYSSGLRVSELVNANLQDVSATQREIRVLGKGNKERVVPVGGKAMDALNTWLKCRGEFALPDEPALFVSKQKRRISARQVRVRMKEWGIKQGISTSIHPHKLRHSFASHILQSSGDLRAVQELLGHSSLSSTQVYTHLDFQHLAKVYDNSHPRAKKRNRE